MSLDDDLRRTLQSEATRYDPADSGWDGITTGVRAVRTRRRRIRTGVLGALAAAIVVVGISIPLADDRTDDGSDVVAGPATTDPGPTTPPTSEAPPGPVTEPADDAVFPGIWPFMSQQSIDAYADGDTRFEDPVATADAFARDYLGMLDPAVSAAGAANGGAVQVELRPRGEDGEPVPDGGASTVVTLAPYQTSYGATIWTVVHAASPNIAVTEPTAASMIASPLVVRGEATGYEGTVLAQVRQDGMRAGQSLGEAVGIAGSMGALGPLELDVAFRAPTEPTGALVLTTDTGRGGVGVPEATVVRVAFAEVVERTEGGAAAPCAAPAPPGPVDDDSMEVVVYLACETEVATNPDAGADEVFVAVTRVVPRSVGVLRAALGELLSGTTPSEDEAGLTSIFSADTADVLGDVTIDDGTAVIDLRATVDNASTSAGSLVFSGQLNRTVFQFPTVERVEYRLDGSCEAFWEWLQVGGCQVLERDDG